MVRVAVDCPACDTRVTVDADRAGDVARTHNQKRHDGDALASIAPEHLGRLAGDR